MSKKNKKYRPYPSDAGTPILQQSRFQAKRRKKMKKADIFEIVEEAEPEGPIWGLTVAYQGDMDPSLSQAIKLAAGEACAGEALLTPLPSQTRRAPGGWVPSSTYVEMYFEGSRKQMKDARWNVEALRIPITTTMGPLDNVEECEDGCCVACSDKTDVVEAIRNAKNAQEQRDILHLTCPTKAKLAEFAKQYAHTPLTPSMTRKAMENKVLIDLAEESLPCSKCGHLFDVCSIQICPKCGSHECEAYKPWISGCNSKESCSHRDQCEWAPVPGRKH